MGRKPGSAFRVAVLAGGDSAERAVSLASGSCVAKWLRQAGHQVELVDPSRCDLDSIRWERFDGCFLALHGGSGEDGRVQSRLERLGVGYTGSGPEASQLAMSKSAAKAVFLEAGIPTPDYVLLDPRQAAERMIGRVQHLGFPLVVKPDGQAPAWGLKLSDQPRSFPAGLPKVRALDRWCWPNG